jgi:beta-N-acetylhexosaminidase
MNRNNAWAWALMLVATLLFGVGLGLSLGYAFFAPREPVRILAADVPAAQPAPEQTPSPNRPEAAPPAVQPQSPAGAPAPAAKPTADYWAARHLFITVNGQWLAENARTMLSELRPGGVLLTEGNLGSRAQTFALVREIKQAVGLGEGLGDLPLIAVQQEGGTYNLVGVENAPSAQIIGQNGDKELALRLGREYGEACVGRGIAIAFAPVLDVFEVGAINPGFAARSFGSDQSVVATLGLAMADGLRQGGVLPVVKYFPGYGASTYGADGLLVVLNKDYGGLARVMYPFNEAVRYGVPGILVGHVAVPALDPENPRRPAALSPVLVNDLLRVRWGYDGVVIADDVALNSMTRAMGSEAAAVQALKAGCDAVLILDADPKRIRGVASAIAAAVADETLARDKLDRSVTRLGRWQDAIGNLHPIAPEPDTTQVAALPFDPPSAAKPEPDPLTQQPSLKPTAPPSETTEVSAPDQPPPAPVGDEREQVSPPAEPVAAPMVTANPSPAQTEAISPAAPPGAQDPAVVTRGTETPPEAAATKPEPLTIPPEQPSAIEEETPAESDPAQPAPAGPAPDSGEPSPAAGAEVTPEEAARSSIVHIVKEGELLSNVAALYEVSIVDLVRWNNIESAQIEPGVELTVYLPDAIEQPAVSLHPQPESENLETPTEPEDVPAEIPVAAGKLVHTVSQGETLSAIADRYEVSMADITLWNGLESPALTEGQILTIFLEAEPAPAGPEAATSEPGGETAASAPAPAAEPAPAGSGETRPRPAHYTPKTTTTTYVVKSGDTLMNIAREHTTTVETLLSLNQLKDANQIFVGQKLQVPATN